MVEATIGVRSPSFARLFLYHLPNNQQQGCMVSSLVTGRGRRCYDDRSMWEPEWSELTKTKGRLQTVNTTATEIGPRW